MLEEKRNHPKSKCPWKQENFENFRKTSRNSIKSSDFLRSPTGAELRASQEIPGDLSRDPSISTDAQQLGADQQKKGGQKEEQNVKMRRFYFKELKKKLEKWFSNVKKNREKRVDNQIIDEKHSPSFSSLNVRLLCKHKHAGQREQSHFVISSFPDPESSSSEVRSPG